jgi:hypothetical protein
MLLSPRRLFFSVLMVLFLAELVVMFILFRLGNPGQDGFKDLLDSTLLTLLLAPFLWWWIMRPLGSAAMREEITGHKRAEEAVRRICGDWRTGVSGTFEASPRKVDGQIRAEPRCTAP